VSRHDSHDKKRVHAEGQHLTSDCSLPYEGAVGESISV
jgi:hypothetical protein